MLAVAGVTIAGRHREGGRGGDGGREGGRVMIAGRRRERRREGGRDGGRMKFAVFWLVLHDRRHAGAPLLSHIGTRCLVEEAPSAPALVAAVLFSARMSVGMEKRMGEPNRKNDACCNNAR